MAGPDQAFVLQFEDSYDLLYQQLMARLMRYVRVKNATNSASTAFGLLGPVDSTDITNVRHGDTNFTDSPSTRRWAPKRDEEVAQLLDKQDEYAILLDLEMGYLRNAIATFQRLSDKYIIDAVTGAAMSGQYGTTSSSFDTTAPVTADGSGGYQITVGGTGLTLDKMRTARAVFDVREVGLDGVSMGMREFVWVMAPAQHQDLLEQTEATSTDYMGVVILPNGDLSSSRMPLVQGRIPHYMGFDLVLSNQLNTTGGDRINLAWHKMAMGFARWGAERNIWMGELPTKHMAKGVIMQEHLGAVRIQDKGVLAIVCDE
jgi:hypothetical protein